MQRLKTLYLKTRLISLSSQIPFLAADLTLQPIEELDSVYDYKDSFGYEQALFLSGALKKWKLDMSLFSPSETYQFEIAKQRIENFAELNDFMTETYELLRCLKESYVMLSTEITASNVYSFNTDSRDDVVSDLKSILASYNELEQKLDEYPLWQEKVKSELGKYINLIASIHKEGGEMADMLEDFDKPGFFK